MMTKKHYIATILDDLAITYKLLLYFFFKGANNTNAFSQFDKSNDL
jgi:hypothetical protein